jgi:hypothetical protein
MLMLYAAADRYLKTGGRLGFVITQTLFQTKGAGDGFRRFRLGAEGEHLGVRRVDDLVALRPFGDAANWTSVIVLEKGRPTEYPVPYFKWQKDKSVIPYLACPINGEKPGSPWRLTPKLLEQSGRCLQAGPSDYRAYLGANSGGANGVYWVEVLGKADGGVRIRNLAQKGECRVEAVEAVIEPDLLFPLLRWRDVGRYSARPSDYLLLVQDGATRTGFDESLMHEKFPRTLDYLRRFEKTLRARAAYRRYQESRPFYSMYNVGPYTFSPIKVVWRRMDRRLNAAVAQAVDDPLLGRRPMVPQETCVLIACETPAEAHYLCAALNSSPVNELVQSHSVQGGKGFGTPSMLEYLNLRRFDPQNARHQELAALSAVSHEKSTAEMDRRIDELMARESL